MPTFKTSDLSRRSGDLIAAALQGPVTITQRNKPRLVVLSVEAYRRLTEAAQPAVYTLDTMPDVVFEDFALGVQQFADDEPTS